MGLSKKKRKFVLQNAHLSPEELSKKVGAGINDIKEFVAERVQGLQTEKVESIWQIIKGNWKFLLIILALVVAVYANGMNANFVSDDYATLNQNSEVGNISYVRENFSLLSVGYYIFYHLFGNQNPTPYHLFSLFLYGTSLVLGYVFLYLITKSKELTNLSLVIYAVLPVHVEGVTWISGKPYLYLAITSLWIVLSFYYLEKTKSKTYLISLISALFVGIFTVKFWVANTIFLYLLLKFSVGEFGQFTRKLKLSYFLMVTFLVLTMIAFYFPAIKERVTVVNSGTVSVFYNPFEQYPTSVSKYLQLIVFPVDLTLYHTLFINPVWLNWLIFILYFACLFYFAKQNKIIFWGLAFTFLASSIAMSPLRVSWMVAERYVFFGSLGISLIFGLMFYKLNSKLPLFGYFLLTVVCGVFAFRIYLRNIDWQTNHNLWVNTCQVSPNSHNAWNNIGDDYDKLAQYENAVKGFTQSTVVKPDYADAFHNRANIFYKMGRLDLAKDSYLTAIKLNPTLYQSYLSLAQVVYTEKDYPLVDMILDRLLSLDNNNFQGLYMKAVNELTQGKRDSAKKLVEQSLNINPGFTPARDLLKQIN